MTTALTPNPVAWMSKTGHGTYWRDSMTPQFLALEHGGQKMWQPLYSEKDMLAAQQRIAALEAELAACKKDAELVRSLLWDAHPECCGCPVVGAEYMGAQEMVCCGNPSMDTLNDWQIVNTLRAKFPAIDAALAAQEKA